MIRVDTMGVYHFEVMGKDADEAASTLKEVLEILYNDCFDVCEELPRVRQALEASYDVSIIAKF